MNGLSLLRGLGALALLVLCGFFIRFMNIDAVFSEVWVDTDIRGSGITGEIIFVFLCGMATAVGLPRQIVSFLGGYAFGFIWGASLALLATVIGCIATFSFARFFGQGFFKLQFKKRLKRLDEFLSENPFTMTLLIRFLPAGSNLITSLTAGLSSVSGFSFLAGSAIGFIPQTAIFALAGAGVTVDHFYSLALSAVLLVISALLSFYLYRRFRCDKKT